MSDNARTSAKRSRSPSPSESARSLRTAKKSFSTTTTMPDAQLRSRLANLSKEQLESLIMQVAQFNPSTKESVISLLPAPDPSGTLSYHYFSHQCRVWLEDPWDRKDTTELKDMAYGVAEIIKENIASILQKAEWLEDMYNRRKAYSQWMEGVDAVMDIANSVIQCKNKALREFVLKTEVIHHLEQGIFNMAGKMGFDESCGRGVEYMSAKSSILDAAYKLHSRDDFEYVHTKYRKWANQNAGVYEEGDADSDY